MLKKEVLDAIQNLDYTDCELSDEFYEKLYWEDVYDIIKMNGGFEDIEEVINALPKHVRFVYLLLDLQSTIMNDGLLSVFYNKTASEVRQLLDTVKTAGMTELFDLLENARQLILTKFTWPNNGNILLAQFHGKRPYDAIGEEICEQIESIEQEVDGMFGDEKFWKRVEVIWNSLQK